MNQEIEDNKANPRHQPTNLRENQGQSQQGPTTPSARPVRPTAAAQEKGPRRIRVKDYDAYFRARRLRPVAIPAEGGPQGPSWDSPRASQHRSPWDTSREHPTEGDTSPILIRMEGHPHMDVHRATQEDTPPRDTRWHLQADSSERKRTPE